MYNTTDSFIYEDVKNKTNVMNSDIKSSNKLPYLHKKFKAMSTEVRTDDDFDTDAHANKIAVTTQPQLD